jgi:hypothetical protein
MTAVQARPALTDSRGARSDAALRQAEPTLAERLIAARERKGIDLGRAERDTRIRTAHLRALEAGDHSALPSDVYSRGFVRTYARYLELDPDDLVGLWRRERAGSRTEEVVDVGRSIHARRAIAYPRRRVTLSPGVLLALLLTVLIAAFAIYLTVQVLRVARPPSLVVTAPAVAILSVNDSLRSYVLRGTSIAGAIVSVATPGRDPYRVSAGTDGSWAAEVALRRGPNEFDISATDPATGKSAENTAKVLIRVPLPVFAPAGAPGKTSGR